MASTKSNRYEAGRLLAIACVLVGLLSTVYLTIRCFAHAELSYNEGWNVYNAQTVAAGGELYPKVFGWRTVNYPALSFLVGAMLHRITGQWLLPARLLALLATFVSAFLIGAVLRALGAGLRASWLGSAFTLMLFCISGTAYVGVDDPQMLAEAVFLFALWMYVRRDASTQPTPTRVAIVAVLFVVAGCIKQSPIEFPLAVFLDLLLASPLLACWFAFCGIVAGAAGVVWNIWMGGPGFLQAMLLGRGFSLHKSAVIFTNMFGPLLLPFCLAVFMAVRLRHDRRRRLLSLLLLTGFVTGAGFSGGTGVSVNAWFGELLAVAMLVGWSFYEFGETSEPKTRLHWWRSALPGILFLWMVIPAITEQVWNPVSLWRQQRSAEAQYIAEVKMLRAQPGPALCESLLRCQEAGKPYRYDPFNSTRLVESGQLSAEPLLQELRGHEFGAIQMRVLPPGDPMTRERFSPEVGAAILHFYQPVLRNEDGLILLPRVSSVR